MTRLSIALAIAACGSPQAKAPPAAPPPAPVSPASSDAPPSTGDPSTYRSADVLPVDQLDWVDRPSAPGAKAAIVWQQDDEGGAIAIVPPGSHAAPQQQTRDYASITLGTTPQLELVEAAAAPRALTCNQTSPCMIYRHSIPSGVQPAAAREWQPYGPDGRFAPLWGTLDGGAFGMLVELKAGTAPFWHIHGQDVRMIVLAGTVDYRASGREPHVLAPGSYVRQPGGFKHTESCQAGADCLLYLHGERGFDVKPM
jgi:hypothetical protein